MRCASGGEGLVQSACGVGRKIVHDDADAVRVGIVRVGEIAHAMGEIAGGPVIGHLHMTLGLVRIEEDKQIGSAVALVFRNRIARVGPARAGSANGSRRSTGSGFRRSKITGRFGSSSSAYRSSTFSVRAT
jgi:hypothetical protein